MSIRTALWKVGEFPLELKESVLETEQLLETMIIAAPSLLSDEWLLIGQQESTGYGGRIDLLAIAPDGALVLIEIKRNRTPRDVVAQALDYAGWVQELDSSDIASIYERFAPGKTLSIEFKNYFGHDLDEESLNSSHQIVIVAGSLDDSTERIIGYLSDRDVAINVLCFQVFSFGTEQVISRAWLRDPMLSQATAAAAPVGTVEPWNGEFYHSFGAGPSRSWEDAVKYGFICAGGGAWYSRTLKQLSVGDRVWVNIPRSGYVGVGIVTGDIQSALEFKVPTPNGDIAVLDAPKNGTYHSEFLNDAEKCEYFVPVKWVQTVPLNAAIQELGMFGNQNTICKPVTPKWRHTVDRLKQLFSNFDNV